MNKNIIIDALDFLDDSFIEEYIKHKQKLLQKKATSRLSIRLVKAAMFFLIVASILTASSIVYQRAGGHFGQQSFYLTEIKTVGEEFTPAEIRKELSSSESLVETAMLQWHNMYPSEFTILQEGYCFVNITENGNFLNLDFMVFPIIDRDGNIIARLDMIRHKSEIISTVSNGGNFAKNFNAVLDEYSSEEIVLVMVDDFVEVAVTPDNKTHVLLGTTDIFDEYLDDEIDFYDIFNKDINTFNSRQE